MKCPKCGAPVLITHFRGQFLKCPRCKKAMKAADIRKDEEQFALTVLITAKKVFKKRERTETGYDKMQNLVCMVATDMKYPLTMGWHKNGLYSPAVDAVIKRYCKPRTKTKDDNARPVTMKNYESEFVVVPGSPLIGRSFKGVEKWFNVRFDHYHDRKVATATRRKPKPMEPIKPYWTLHANGTYKNVARLRKFSVGFTDEDGGPAKPKFEYIYAYDPVIKRRVVHAVIDDVAISLVTGHKFQYRGTQVKHYCRKSPLPRRRGHSRYTVRVKGHWKKGGTAT